jgi:hypothetical protein
MVTGHDAKACRRGQRDLGPPVLPDADTGEGGGAGLRLWMAVRSDDAPFGRDTLLRRVHGQVAMMLIDGVAVLLVQRRHPAAPAAVWKHSALRIDVLGRLRRAARPSAVTACAERGQADVAIGRLKAVNGRVGPWRSDQRLSLRKLHAYGSSWMSPIDPNPPGGFLQSCPMLSPRFSRFASTERPFVTSHTRPLPVLRDSPLRSQVSTTSACHRAQPVGQTSPADQWWNWITHSSHRIHRRGQAEARFHYFGSIQAPVFTEAPTGQQDPDRHPSRAVVACRYTGRRQAKQLGRHHWS